MLNLFKKKKKKSSSPSPSAQTTSQAPSKSEASSDADNKQYDDRQPELPSVSATAITDQVPSPTAMTRTPANTLSDLETKLIPGITDATTPVPDTLLSVQPTGFDSGYDESSESSSNPDQDNLAASAAGKSQEDPFDQLIASDDTFTATAIRLLNHYLCQPTPSASFLSRIRYNIAYYAGRNHTQAVGTILKVIDQHTNLASLTKALHTQGVTNPNPDGHLMKILNALNRKFQADDPLSLEDYFKEEATTQALAGTSIN